MEVYHRDDFTGPNQYFIFDFLFSAARGREWELMMARRMPSSVRLVCVEYENKQDVKAIIGRDGGNVFFPEVRKTIVDDGFGGHREVETSNERDILRDLALSWFDNNAPFIGYKNGVMGINGDYSLKDQPASNDMSITTGSANTIGSNALDASYDGFPRHLPEGLPAAMAAYAFKLNSRPMFSLRQWTPDPDPLFNNSKDHHHWAEPISIGCEAWIDVGRFCAAEKPAHHATKTPTGMSLTRSFTDIRRKFQKSSDEDMD